LARIQDHLEALKRTPDGLTLYRLIERGLARFGDAEGRMAGTFLGFLHALLGRYAGSADTDPGTRMRARMIQQRLAVYRLEAAVAGADNPARAAPQAPGPAAAQSPPAPAAAPAEPEPTPAPVLEPATPRASRWNTVASLTGGRPLASPRARPPGANTEHPPSPPPDPDPPVAHARVEELAEVVASTLSTEALAAPAGDAAAPMAPVIPDFGNLKRVLIDGMDELLRAHSQLKEQLTSAAQYIQEVESEREKLQRDLGKARKHSMTDELTGLVRREVFLRQLEAEISRARRYGFAIALAIIDLDDLSSINAEYGNPAGDQVLRCYAREVLSCFRAYDLVARYGGDELAVLFPNTQKDGAMQALEKARRLAAQTYVSVNGHSIPLPGFSSVLTVYSPGEAPAALLKRADQALDTAKRESPGRTVVALPGG